MDNITDLKKFVDQDILYCAEILDKYSYDKEKVSEAFNRLVFRYIERIDGFASGLKVVTEYEKAAEGASVYRENLKILSERLKIFRDNGYSNLSFNGESYKEENMSFKHQAMFFNQARRDLESLYGITQKEFSEITDKIDEIEEIMVRVIPKEQKWSMLRPYVMWLSGKEVSVARIILPLISKI